MNKKSVSANTKGVKARSASKMQSHRTKVEFQPSRTRHSLNSAAEMGSKFADQNNIMRFNKIK